MGLGEKSIFPHDQASLVTMFQWAKARIEDGPDPRNGALTHAELTARLGQTVTDQGLGWAEAFRLFEGIIAPSTRPFNHPTSLAFVAAAPSPAALGFDAVLGAAEIFAGNWDGGSGAIYAENQTIHWLAGLAGFSSTAGGVFVSGGTLGNLSALHAARVRYQASHEHRPERYRILCSTQAHSSIEAVAKVMDAELVQVSSDAQGRVVLNDAREKHQQLDGIFAIVANAGATNSGAVDDIATLADVAAEKGTWLHVDGAYGLAALADPVTRPVFNGIERADSFIVDPHKWLFAPYDSCALVYRDAAEGAIAHGQSGAYLDTLDQAAWNPSDFALHLSRRARGLPLWFSLAVYGAEAYAQAIRKTCEIAREIADGIEETGGLDLILGPQLTVILFNVKDKSAPELAAWSEEHRRSGSLLCLPTTWHGETVLRICVVNPETDPGHVLSALKTAL